MFSTYSINYFNLVEGAFWLVLGIVTLLVYRKVSKTYKALALFSAFALIAFGVSDFLQMVYGSFLVEGMEWLFFWKIINVIGLCVIPVWYVILRIKNF